MKKIRINREDLTFHVPPEGSGQMVETSYALVTEEAFEGFVLKKIFDKSTGEEAVTLHGLIGDSFDPWNGVPTLNKRGIKVELY